MTKMTLSEYFPSVQDRAQNSFSVDSRNLCKHLKDKPPIGKAVASVFVLPSIMFIGGNMNTCPLMNVSLKTLVTSFIYLLR